VQDEDRAHQSADEHTEHGDESTLVYGGETLDVADVRDEARDGERQYRRRLVALATSRHPGSEPSGSLKLA
jgi:hypothetical protein